MPNILKKYKTAIVRSNQDVKLRLYTNPKPEDISKEWIFTDETRAKKNLISHIFSITDKFIGQQSSGGKSTKRQYNQASQASRSYVFSQLINKFDVKDFETQLSNLNATKKSKDAHIQYKEDATEQIIFNSTRVYNDHKFYNLTGEELIKAMQKAVQKKLESDAKSLQNNTIDKQNDYLESLVKDWQDKLNNDLNDFIATTKVTDLTAAIADNTAKIAAKAHISAAYNDWYNKHSSVIAGDPKNKFFKTIIHEAITKTHSKIQLAKRKDRQQLNLLVQLRDKLNNSEYLLNLARNKFYHYLISQQKLNLFSSQEQTHTSDSLRDIQVQQAVMAQFINACAVTNFSMRMLVSKLANKDVLGGNSVISDLFVKSANYPDSSQVNLAAFFKQEFINQINQPHSKLNTDERLFVRYLKQIASNVRHHLYHFDQREHGFVSLKTPAALFDWNNKWWKKDKNDKYLNQAYAEKIIELAKTDYAQSWQEANDHIVASLRGVKLHKWFSQTDIAKFTEYTAYKTPQIAPFKPKFNKVWQLWLDLISGEKLDKTPFALKTKVFSKHYNKPLAIDTNKDDELHAAYEQHAAVKRICQLIYQDINLYAVTPPDLVALVTTVCQTKLKRTPNEHQKSESHYKQLEQYIATDKDPKNFFAYISQQQSKQAKAVKNQYIEFITELYLTAMRNKLESLKITTAKHSIGEQAIEQVYTPLQNKNADEATLNAKLDKNWQANLHLYCHLLTASELNNLTNELKKAKHAYYDQHATADTQADITKMLEIVALNQQTLAAKTQSYSSVVSNKPKSTATIAKKIDSNIELTPATDFNNTDIAKLYQEKNKLHSKLCRQKNIHAADKDKYKKYKEIILQINTYQQDKNIETGFYKQHTQKLFLALLSRLVGFIHAMERDLQLINTKLEFTTSTYTDERAYNEFTKKVINTFFQQHYNEEGKYAAKRNYIAHLNWMTSATKTFIELVNETRQLLDYDRKRKNAVTKALIDIFAQYDLTARFTFDKQHNVTRIALASQQAEHLQHLDGNKIKVPVYPPEYIEQLNCLLKFKNIQQNNYKIL